MEALPLEVVMHIMEHCDISTLCVLRLVCVDWYDLSFHVKRPWRQQYMRIFRRLPAFFATPERLRNMPNLATKTLLACVALRTGRNELLANVFKINPTRRFNPGLACKTTLYRFHVGEAEKYRQAEEWLVNKYGVAPAPANN